MTEMLKPEPDGKLVVVLRHDISARVPVYDSTLNGQVALTTSESVGSIREYSMAEAKWLAHSWGLEIARTSAHPDGHGRDLFPFTNMLTFSVLPNSTDFETKSLEFIRQCDHTWLTHPQVPQPLTYCETCRVDMSDLASVMDPQTTELPGLVVESPDLDRVSHAFDGRDPFDSEIPRPEAEAEQSGPAKIVIDADDVPEDIQRLVDEQLRELELDDPDSTEF